MSGIIKRAWRDTLAGVGLSDFSVVRVVLSVAISAAFVGLIWFWRGEMEAITKASDIVFYGLAFVSVAFIPLFLWNLWLAPFKILHERLDEVASTQNPPKAVDEEIARISRDRIKKSHALHDSNKITPKEWEAVTHPALIDAWAAQYEIVTSYPESPAGHPGQEAVAERFGEAAARGSQRGAAAGVAPVRQA